MSASATPQPHSHVVYTEFDGNEAVLVDLNTKRYYTLNETAMLVWRGLESGKSTDEIVRDMCKQYEVSEARASQSVGRLLTSLSAHRLLA